ncbi:MAG: glycosyltransferase [Proteobacteria bacterium]|nr:glycosyltransferase [Pseudomonadota bacterium]
MASAPKSVSVVTLAGGRAEHLKNLMLGLAQQSHQPDEFVIAYMQDTPYEGLPALPFPVRQVQVAGKPLPLAKARNTLAREASGELLVYLDVDCIPAPDLVADYVWAAGQTDALLMGEVYYLTEGANAPGWTFAGLEKNGVEHTWRYYMGKRAVEPCSDYNRFWSLNFAIPRAQFVKSGGFDERFVGYGAEDTDFSKMLAERGVPLAFVGGAKCYHQYHAHHMPPTHHFDSVVRNAQLFEEKWGYRTMEQWLYAFYRMGLIKDSPQGIVVLRRPEEKDFALSYQSPDMPFTDAVRVIEHFDAQAGIKSDPKEWDMFLKRPSF